MHFQEQNKVTTYIYIYGLQVSLRLKKVYTFSLHKKMSNTKTKEILLGNVVMKLVKKVFRCYKNIIFSRKHCK